MEDQFNPLRLIRLAKRDDLIKILYTIQAIKSKIKFVLLCPTLPDERISRTYLGLVITFNFSQDDQGLGKRIENVVPHLFPIQINPKDGQIISTGQSAASFSPIVYHRQLREINRDLTYGNNNFYAIGYYSFYESFKTQRNIIFEGQGYGRIKKILRVLNLEEIEVAINQTSVALYVHNFDTSWFTDMKNVYSHLLTLYLCRSFAESCLSLIPNEIFELIVLYLV